LSYSESISNKSIFQLKGAFTMNIPTFKSTLPIAIASTSITVMSLFGGSQPALSRAMSSSHWLNPAATTLAANHIFTTGALLEGRNQFVY
jgi:hypothetical protein